jgi:hypothetical protein
MDGHTGRHEGYKKIILLYLFSPRHGRIISLTGGWTELFKMITAKEKAKHYTL